MRWYISPGFNRGAKAPPACKNGEAGTRPGGSLQPSPQLDLGDTTATTNCGRGTVSRWQVHCDSQLRFGEF